MSGSKRNVLIFPSGAENALEIYRSIRFSVHVNVLAATSRDDVSQLVYEDPVLHLPEMDDPSFLAALRELIEANDIDIVFPTHDSAALFLAEHAHKLSTRIANADLRTNVICRHKRKTYELFQGESFCPTVFDVGTAPSRYPIYAKPDVGQGGKGARRIEDAGEHRRLSADPDLLFVEYLPGREYTVDCFTDRDGVLRFVGTRERVEVRMGISFRSREVESSPAVQSIAESINAALDLRGLWFFQLKESEEGELKLLEVSTRAAGTGGFFRHKGVNLPLLTIFDLLEMPITIDPSGYQVELFRSTVNYYRYSFHYSHVYVDLDDTLLVNDAVNDGLVRYLYAAVSSGKRLTLITKHAGCPEETLRAHRLAPSLFDEIIHVTGDERKVDRIDPSDAILIDNWYMERREVAEKLDIPVFDVDAVDSLVHSL